MRTITILAILIFASGTISEAQMANIKINTGNEQPSEPSVCINPKNPDEIIIGTNVNNCYSSDDGGLSWVHASLVSSYGVNCDPVILTDTSGNFYYFHLVPNLSRVVCQKKEGFSSPWTDGSYTALYNTSEMDKEWAAYDPVTNNLYTSWTRFSNYQSSSPQDSSVIFLSKSTDGGSTWGEQKRISRTKGNATGSVNSVHGSYPATGPNGEVYVTWWSRAGLMFDKSTDEGETWLEQDINITGSQVEWLYLLPGIQIGVSFPVVACDRSNGPQRGTIYLNWTDLRNGGNDGDIWLVKSTDGGITWSAPKRVNDDGPGRQQFFNFMTIDQVTGKIYIIFYDRRNYTNTNTDVWLAISDDGGENFANYKISETPFIPFSTVFFGHYISISAYNNKVFATWMRMDEGNITLWGTSINPATVGVVCKPAIPFSLAQNAPNPFQENTFFSFKLEKPSTVTLSVVDLFGNKVAMLINNESMTDGKHVIHFSPEDYHLKSGMYYYSLVTNNKTITRKMIYAKQAP